MAVVLETTLGDITIDLYINERPKACLNFLKLCKVKYYNFNLFHTVNQGFIAQTGDPTGSRIGGESIWGVMEGPLKRYFEMENTPRIKHTSTGLVSFVGDNNMIGSQFFITLAPDLTYLDSQHCVFGEVTEGFDILRLLNEAICDTDHRPYQDIRITHTVVLEDPFPDPEKLKIPDASPEPTAERLQGGRIAPDEAIDETEGKSAREIVEIIAEKEAKARATILEMIGDIPDADMAPPENVLFICKLNPVTTDDDLEIIFSRFGKIKSCEVIRDKKTGDSLQYAFVEFEEQKSCEDAYFKMDNVLIDDRRIHVDFSQSVAKIKWHGKGRGVTHFNDRGEKLKDGPENKSKQQTYSKNRRNNSDDSRRSRSVDERKFKQEENQQRKTKDTEKLSKSPTKEDYRRSNDKRNRNYEELGRRMNSESRSRDDQRFRYDNYQQRGQNSKGFRYRNRNYEEERKGRMKSRSQSTSRNNQRFRHEDYQQRRQNFQGSRFRNNYRSPDYRNKNYKRINDNDFRSRETERLKRREYEHRGYYYKENRRRNESDYKFNRKYEQDKRRKYEEESSEDEKKSKKKKKRRKSSSEDSSSEDSSPRKSNKSKKKKKYDSESNSDSDSSDKKSKKKSKKNASSSSDSENESEIRIKKKSKKY